jgi:hypothetical protein
MDPILRYDSGYAASHIHSDVLYTYNDDDIFAINATDAHLLATLNIGPEAKLDWWDITVGPCGAGSRESCIYIGGDEDGRPGGDDHSIYRMSEPDKLLNPTLHVASKLPFR